MLRNDSSLRLYLSYLIVMYYLYVMLTKYKKDLRRNQTDAESVLWYNLRDRRFKGWKFRRQHIIKNHIVDFICLDQKLIIELDGGQHALQKEYDLYRSASIEKDGYTILRFWNHDVLSNLEGVLITILNHLRQKQNL